MKVSGSSGPEARPHPRNLRYVTTQKLLLCKLPQTPPRNNADCHPVLQCDSHPSSAPNPACHQRITAAANGTNATKERSPLPRRKRHCPQQPPKTTIHRNEAEDSLLPIGFESLLMHSNNNGVVGKRESRAGKKQQQQTMTGGCNTGTMLNKSGRETRPTGAAAATHHQIVAFIFVARARKENSNQLPEAKTSKRAGRRQECNCFLCVSRRWWCALSFVCTATPTSHASCQPVNRKIAQLTVDTMVLSNFLKIG